MAATPEPPALSLALRVMVALETYVATALDRVVGAVVSVGAGGAATVMVSWPSPVVSIGPCTAKSR